MRILVSSIRWSYMHQLTIIVTHQNLIQLESSNNKLPPQQQVSKCIQCSYSKATNSSCGWASEVLTRFISFSKLITLQQLDKNNHLRKTGNCIWSGKMATAVMTSLPQFNGLKSQTASVSPVKNLVGFYIFPTRVFFWLYVFGLKIKNFKFIVINVFNLSR